MATVSPEPFSPEGVPPPEQLVRASAAMAVAARSEVFFKVCKSYLRLEKDCRALSYDAITAHTAIVFARYMLFAVEERRSKDDRTIGELFYLCIDELADIKYQEALRLILVTLVELADSSVCITSSSDMKMLIQSFMNDLPEIWTNALKKCA